MTSSALHSQNLTPAQTSSVGEALHDLAVAGHRLLRALWANLGLRVYIAAPALTPFEEAEQLRAFADKQRKTDPRFADELYAAATRHELSAKV